MTLTGKQIVGATFAATGEKCFTAVNPADGSVLSPIFGEATADDVGSAADAAACALDPYREISLSKRAVFLESIAEELLADGETLLARAHAETSLPRPRLEGELARTVNQLRMFAQLVREGNFLELRIDRAQPDRSPVPKPDLRTMHLPIGPVAVFGASNFPLAFSVAGGDTAAALAAGCPVVVKGHPAHPGTGELAGQAVMRAVHRHSVPPGVFSLLQSSDIAAGEQLVRHPSIKAVAFTGSLTAGRALFDIAAARPEPIPVYAEMGSVNPVFVLPQIVAEQPDSLAAGLVDSITLGVGQFCTAPGLVMALRDASTDTFLRSIQAGLAAKPPGVMLHQGIKRHYLAGLERLAAAGVTRCGDSPPTPGGCQALPALWHCEAQDLLDKPALTGEVFGPSAIFVSCASREQLLQVAAALPGQLTATVHGVAGELESFRDLLAILERKAGRLICNGFPTGVEVCPAMHHGGPYPATTDSRSTSVGTEAVKRFLHPVCYQGFAQGLLPEPLRDRNPQGLWRLVDGRLSSDDL